jgi:hypothetical protein
MTLHTRQGQRGFSVIAMSLMLIIVIPIIGLAIDTTVLYIDKARLQASVDGAALAGAKALARGTTDPLQQAAAKTAAATYVMLNYPSTYFFSNSVTVNQNTDITIDETVANQTSVTVNAHANVATLFMRWLSFTSTNVNATATTVRRDVNIAMVVDRSGSLNGTSSCAPLKQSAVNFVNKFSNGRDNIALITFASSTSADFPIATNFQTANPNVVSLLQSITCDGSTSSAMALWSGYDQLVGLNQPGALNVILFFTDGKPTAVNVNMPISNSSPCSNTHPGPPKYINGLYNTYTNQNTFFGLLNPVSTGSVPPDDSATIATPDGNTGQNCAYMANWPTSDQTYTDFLGLPTHDIYGDDMNSGYQAITLNGNGYIDLGTSSNAGNMPMNATDSAATSIRAGTAEPATLPHSAHSLSGVIIYSIGLGNAPYPISTDLLQRVSNDPASSIYNSAQPAGRFILAPTSADIDQAFAAVAAEILRIAK